MQILLNAIHANFASVPKMMDASSLYEVTILTDKYSITHCLQPWAQIWTSKANNPSLHGPINSDRGVGKEDIERIWALQEFGLYSPFEDLLLDIALNATADSDGDIQIWVTDSNTIRISRVLVKL